MLKTTLTTKKWLVQPITGILRFVIFIKFPFPMKTLSLTKFNIWEESFQQIGEKVSIVDTESLKMSTNKRRGGTVILFEL